MHRHKLERVLVVNDAFELKGVMTAGRHHQADQLSQRRATPRVKLRVGAAVGSAGQRGAHRALVKAGVDAIVVDTAHGHSRASSSACAGSSATSRRST